MSQRIKRARDWLFETNQKLKANIAAGTLSEQDALPELATIFDIESMLMEYENMQKLIIPLMKYAD